MASDTDTGARDVTAAALAYVEAAKGRADAIGDDMAPFDLAPGSTRGHYAMYESMIDIILDDVPLLAAIASAAVRLGPRWWVFSDGYGRTRCTQCYAWTEGDSSDLEHAAGCRAMQLDAAIRAAGETAP